MPFRPCHMLITVDHERQHVAKHGTQMCKANRLAILFIVNLLYMSDDVREIATPGSYAQYSSL